MSLRPCLIVAAFAALGLPAAPVHAQSHDIGAYLAARQASGTSDYRAAAEYYQRALSEDPDNPLLLESALVAYAALGEMQEALPLAERLRDAGADSRIADSVVVASAAEHGAYARLLTDLEEGLDVGPLFDGLVRGWAHVGAGDREAALAAFGAAGGDSGLAIFGLYHKALALAAEGEFEAAYAVFEQDAAAALDGFRRGLLAQAQILSQLGRRDEAIALLDAAIERSPDAGLERVRARLEAGETLAFDIVRDAQDGVAEVFHSVAGALSGEVSEAYTLVYSRLAAYLRPEHADALLLSGMLLESQGNYEAAAQVYRKVPRDAAAFFAAELGRADTLRARDEPEAAIEVLTQLAESEPGHPLIQAELGDALRGEERYGAATQAYDTAIELSRPAEAGDWSLFYRRAITHERQGRWPKAEADFRKALDLSPDQPEVLNYLGYSLAERREKLDSALDMIRRAVEARPDDGYIRDSLGWVLYRLGRYEAAVAPMERAVELAPVDPVVNDHLGDVYWSVGREREARFQWKRALSFEPDADRSERIRRKLAVGLDEVRAKEGDAPVSVADDD